MQRGLARQSVGRVPRLEGTVEGRGFPHERLHQEAIAEAISRIVGCKIKGISSDEAISKWGVGIAAFFSNNNQVSAKKAREQLGWKPQTALSLLEDIAQTYKLSIRANYS